MESNGVQRTGENRGKSKHSQDGVPSAAQDWVGRALGAHTWESLKSPTGKTGLIAIFI